jgi:hypothetical protein
MHSVPRIGRVLLLLLMIFAFSVELSAQFTQQAKLVGSGYVSRPVVLFDIPVPVG